MYILSSDSIDAANGRIVSCMHPIASNDAVTRQYVNNIFFGRAVPGGQVSADTGITLFDIGDNQYKTASLKWNSTLSAPEWIIN